MTPSQWETVAVFAAFGLLFLGFFVPGWIRTVRYRRRLARLAGRWAVRPACVPQPTLSRRGERAPRLAAASTTARTARRRP